MNDASPTPKLFGDLLALARGSWVREMAQRLDALGYHDYRRSDAITLRWLSHGRVPLSELTATLGVSRQAARKVVDGLVERGYARVERDPDDARRLNVTLSESGDHYARAVIDVVRDLNSDLDARIDAYDLVVVKAVLRAVSALYGNA
jgi:DNA-binding MarR family transcriptional regulator